MHFGYVARLVLKESSMSNYVNRLLIGKLIVKINCGKKVIVTFYFNELDARNIGCSGKTV